MDGKQFLHGPRAACSTFCDCAAFRPARFNERKGARCRAQRISPVPGEVLRTVLQHKFSTARMAPCIKCSEQGDAQAIPARLLKDRCLQNGNGEPERDFGSSSPRATEIKDTTASSCTSKEIWQMAWRDLEAPEKEAQSWEQLGRGKRKRNDQGRADGSNRPAESLAAKPWGKPLRRTCLALQGLRPSARAQLLAVSLLALEKQTAALPLNFLRAGSEADWRLLLPALLSSCSVMAAQAWLGYTPSEIQAEATHLIAQLEAGSNNFEQKLQLHQSEKQLQLLEKLRAAAARAPGEQGGELGEAGRGLWQPAAQKAKVHALALRYVALEAHSPASPAEPSRTDSHLPSHQPPPVKDCGQPRNALSRLAKACSTSLARLAGGASKTRQRPAAAAPDKNREAGQVSATRAAAEKLLDQKIVGVRGWGPRPGSQGTSPEEPIMREAHRVVQDMAVCIAEAVAVAYLAEASFGFSGEHFGVQRAPEATLRSASTKRMRCRRAGSGSFWFPLVRQLASLPASQAVPHSSSGAVQEPGDFPAGHRRSSVALLGTDLCSVVMKACDVPPHPAGKPGKLATVACKNSSGLTGKLVQLAFQQFVDSHWEEVAAIYEDRQLIWGLAPGAVLLKGSIPVRRAKELQGLKGWKAAVSIILEALDFAAPLLQKVGARGGEALAWLLVTLIGRSLGLIFRGIRMSFKRPKKKAARQKHFENSFAVA